METNQGFNDYTEDDFTEDDYYYEYTAKDSLEEGDICHIGMQGGGGFKNKTFK